MNLNEQSSAGGRFEFWTSVEYGTFLKGLVREFSRDAKTDEVLRGAKPVAALPPPAGGSELLATAAQGGPDARQQRELRSSGSAAAQRFAVTEAEYRQARGTLARLRMRWRCYVGYPLQLRRRIRCEAAPQALVVCTNTFYAPWVAMRAARKRGIPVVHWMFDLFPDVLVLAGKLKPGSLAERWLRRWVRAMFDGAAANVFLGRRLLAYTEAQFGPIPRSVVIAVGCDAQPFAGREPQDRRPEPGNSEGVTAKNAESTKDRGRSLLSGDQGNDAGGGADTPSTELRHGGDKPRPTTTEEGRKITGLETRATRLLYCGNFGRMHDVDTLTHALRGGVPAGLRLDFRGNGAGFQALATAVRELGLGEGVRLGGNLPEAEWLDAMAAADVALVTMKPGAEGLVMPSKTYSAMAAGQAVLAVCPRESDLADLILAHDCGWVIEPGNAAGLRALLESLPSQADEVLRKRKNAWRAGQEVYDQRVLAERWSEVLRGFAQRETLAATPRRAERPGR